LHCDCIFIRDLSRVPSSLNSNSSCERCFTYLLYHSAGDKRLTSATLQHDKAMPGRNRVYDSLERNLFVPRSAFVSPFIFASTLRETYP